MVENFYEVSRVLSKLDKAYNNAEEYEFKKLWLDKWNEYAKKNASKHFKPRSFELEWKMETVLDILEGEGYKVEVEYKQPTRKEGKDD